jgi:hypothetical protein
LAIDFFPVGDVPQLAEHLVDLLQNRERQVEMALRNVSAALRMSMPEIIRQYLRTFELRQDLETMRSLTWLRKLPRWFPMRDALVRRKAQSISAHSATQTGSIGSAGFGPGPNAEIVYMSSAMPSEIQSKTGTDGM